MNITTTTMKTTIYHSFKFTIFCLLPGLKVAYSLLSTSNFRAIKARPSDRPYSPCIQHRHRSDAYYECVLRHLAMGNGQATSTCAIGPEDSPDAVVDSKLR